MSEIKKTQDFLISKGADNECVRLNPNKIDKNPR